MRGENEPPKNKLIAALLAMVGGIVGAHKLYLKDIGGFFFFMMLLFIGINIFGWPITALIGLFQGFKLLNMSQQEFDSQYNGGYVQRGDSRIEKRRAEQMKHYESSDNRGGYARSAEPVRQRANPFKTSGIAKYKEFDLDGAIEDFKKGLDIDPNDVSLNYNIASAYSLSEKKDEAFKHLAKAVSLGFNDFERLLTHDDLAFVRIQPEFDAFKQSGYRVYTGAKRPPQQANIDVEVKQEEVVDANFLDQLTRLAELRDRGLLTEQEFLLEKKKLTRQG